MPKRKCQLAWRCNVCKFENDPKYKQCEFCQTSKYTFSKSNETKVTTTTKAKEKDNKNLKIYIKKQITKKNQ